MTLIDILDYPQLRYADITDEQIIERGLTGGALPCGQYAFAGARGDSAMLARDPVGCNKLFFGHDSEGSLVVGNRISQLWQRKIPLASINSCPPGHVIEVTRAGVRDAGGTDISAAPADPDFNIAEFVAQSGSLLDQTFKWFAREFEGCRFVVCLSGGLDSSVIASFAAKHLKNVTAASFTYLSEDDLRSHARGAAVEGLTSASGDFRSAAKVAAALRMPLVPVIRSRQAVAGAVNSSVNLCQDWRDFNVHCATVNLFLARDIRAAFPGEKVVVLTGDLMNELVCDYREESVDGTLYYKIPRIPVERRRKYFVRGLDAGDREIGVFWAHGLVVAQPFTMLAERYMRIPAAQLEHADVKWTLNGPLLAPQLATHVSKSKTRAQVGGDDLGTLGIYHRLGIGEEQLRHAWQAGFPTESPAACDQLIQFGRYRTPQFAHG